MVEMDEMDFRKHEKRLIDIAYETTKFPLEHGDNKLDDFKKIKTCQRFVGIYTDKAEKWREEFWEIINIMTDTGRFLNPDFLVKKTEDTTRILALIIFYRFPQYSGITAPDSERGITRN